MVQPMLFPSAFALMAANKIVRKSPIAKKFTTNRENRSSVPHRSNCVKVNSTAHQTSNVFFLFGTCSIIRFCARSEDICWLSPDLNPLINAVMKMSDMLSAATVTTGAKISEMTLLSLRCSSSFSQSLGMISPNTCLRIRNGDAAIYNQRIPILAMSTTAKASNGKKSAIAMPVLMMKIHEVSQAFVTLVSESSAKFSNEAYMVTKGPTNHLDLLIRFDIVVQMRSFPVKSFVPNAIPFIHQLSRLTIRGLIQFASCSFHQLVPISVFINFL